MRFRVEKLIRDRLPAMMRAEGLRVFERPLDPEALVAALKDKLVEEAREVGEAASVPDLIDELADVMEVVRALAAARGVSLDLIESSRLDKRAARGGFDAGIFNAAVEADEGSPAAAYYLARPEQYPRLD